MLYLHFCQCCERIHILSGHRKQCPACDSLLTELSVPYEHYIHLNRDERMNLQHQCNNTQSLNELKTRNHSRYIRK